MANNFTMTPATAPTGARKTREEILAIVNAGPSLTDAERLNLYRLTVDQILACLHDSSQFASFTIRGKTFTTSEPDQLLETLEAIIARYERKVAGKNGLARNRVAITRR